MKEAFGIEIKTADWYQLALARTFGERIVGFDSSQVLVAYKWRGNIYVSEYLELPEIQ